jgi:predicted Fe-Mo cluster-binding NifX family protein
MKVAVSSSGKDLKAILDPRFGRCPYFIVANPDDMSFDVFENQAGDRSSGAGIEAAQLVADKGAAAVITGRVGPKAAQALAAAGIDVFREASVTVETALERFNQNRLEPGQSTGAERPPNTGYGTGSGGGRGMGGGGRGMGGGGRGMGGGGRGMGGGGRGMGGGGRGMGGGGGSRR